MSTPQRQAFEDFAAKFCGVPYADLVRGEITGLAFGWACWQEAQRDISRLQVLISKQADAIKEAAQRLDLDDDSPESEWIRDDWQGAVDCVRSILLDSLTSETLTETKPQETP